MPTYAESVLKITQSEIDQEIERQKQQASQTHGILFYQAESDGSTNTTSIVPGAPDFCPVATSIHGVIYSFPSREVAFHAKKLEYLDRNSSEFKDMIAALQNPQYLQSKHPGTTQFMPQHYGAIWSAVTGQASNTAPCSAPATLGFNHWINGRSSQAMCEVQADTTLQRAGLPSDWRDKSAVFARKVALFQIARARLYTTVPGCEWENRRGGIWGVNRQNGLTQNSGCKNLLEGAHVVAGLTLQTNEPNPYDEFKELSPRSADFASIGAGAYSRLLLLTSLPVNFFDHIDKAAKEPLQLAHGHGVGLAAGGHPAPALTPVPAAPAVLPPAAPAPAPALTPVPAAPMPAALAPTHGHGVGPAAGGHPAPAHAAPAHAAVSGKGAYWVMNKEGTRAACFDASGQVICGVFKNTPTSSNWEIGRDLSKFNDMRNYPKKLGGVSTGGKQAAFLDKDGKFVGVFVDRNQNWVFAGSASKMSFAIPSFQSTAPAPAVLPPAAPAPAPALTPVPAAPMPAALAPTHGHGVGPAAGGHPAPPAVHAPALPAPTPAASKTKSTLVSSLLVVVGLLGVVAAVCNPLILPALSASLGLGAAVSASAYGTIYAVAIPAILAIGLLTSTINPGNNAIQSADGFVHMIASPSSSAASTKVHSAPAPVTRMAPRAADVVDHKTQDGDQLRAVVASSRYHR